MPSDPTAKVEYAMANRLPWNSTGLTSEQFNQIVYGLPADWNTGQFKAPR
jgi:hypothetical protein